MTADRILEDYRRHQLLSAFNGGKYRGRAWFNKTLEFELEGTNIDDVLSKLREAVDRKYAKRIVQGAISPTVDAFVVGFQRILKQVNDGQYAMLKAHFLAPNRCLTPEALAEAAGYKDIGGVNLWYGKLGQWLFEEMSVELDLHLYDDGSPVYTSVIARYIPDATNPDGHHVWEMRPEVAKAVEALGLAN